MDTHDYLSTLDAGKAVGLDDSQVRRLCRADLVPHIKVGGVYLIRRADLPILESRPRAGRPKKPPEAEADRRNSLPRKQKKLSRNRAK